MDPNNHGTYTHLCSLGGECVFTHTPVGYVLATFPKDVHADEPLQQTQWPTWPDD